MGLVFKDFHIGETTRGPSHNFFGNFLLNTLRNNNMFNTNLYDYFWQKYDA